MVAEKRHKKSKNFFWSCTVPCRGEECANRWPVKSREADTVESRDGFDVWPSVYCINPLRTDCKSFAEGKPSLAKLEEYPDFAVLPGL